MEQANKNNTLYHSLRKFLNQSGIAKLIDPANLIKNIPLFTLWSFFFLLIVANTRYAEQSMRDINALQQDLKELRWQYMTSKSVLMMKSQQTQIADDIKNQGLEELKEPPKKIMVSK